MLLTVGYEEFMRYSRGRTSIVKREYNRLRLYSMAAS
jgi:hypothetical protein